MSTLIGSGSVVFGLQNRFGLVVARVGLAAVTIGLTVEAHGATITPSAVTASTSYSVHDGQRHEQRTIDSSGLAAGLHNTNAGQMWLSSDPGSESGNTVANTVITWTLSQSESLSGVYLWNYNETGGAARGVGLADVQISDDPTFTVGVTTFSGFAFNAASGAANDPGDFYALPNAATGQYVRFVNMSTIGDPDYIGIAEIRFETASVPEPTSYMLLGSGVAVALWRRRLSRRKV